MKVTNRMISIPPYISTSWANVQAVHMTDGVLVVTILDGEAISIPDLTLQEIDLIFKAHTAFLELDEKNEPRQQTQHNPTSISAGSLPGLLQSFLGNDSNQTPPIRVAFGNLENLGAMMQHNSAQADSPDLPSEVLEKVATVAKWIAPEDTQNIPKAEPHCNCFYCQITRAITGQTKSEHVHVGPTPTPEVAMEELQFQQWWVQQVGESLFVVTNKLDCDEKYSVYLGEPLGCTCGKQGCEHLVAVLQS